MAPRVAFWVDRHVGPEFTVFVFESNTNFYKKNYFEQYMNSRVKILGKILY